MKKLPWMKPDIVYIDKEIAYENLGRAQDALDELGIPFFLSSGTLLGFYRNTDFIDHDPDIDIGVFIDDHQEKIIDRFEEKGLKIKRVYGTKESGLEYSFERKGIQLDIFFYYRNKETVWHGVWYVNKYLNFKFLKRTGLVKPVLKRLEFPAFSTYDFIEYRERRFPIPSNALDYLITQYGETWNIPDPNWDNFKSQKNFAEE